MTAKENIGIFMNYILFSILFFNISIFPQVDKHGNPIFYSIPIDEDTFDNYTLSSNYYTIANNINNPNSSVFINQNPSNDEIIDFVRTKPSYFFIVLKNQTVSHLIMLVSGIEGNKSRFSFFIINPNSQQQTEVPCDQPGDITEFRAAELLEKYENESKELKFGPNSMILFSEIAYSIQPFEDLKSRVINLIDKYQLYKSDIDLEKLK